MYGIGISATFTAMGIVLWKDNIIISHIQNSGRRIHSLILTYIEDFIKQENITISDIEYIVIDTGPGSSFTGLRLSVSTVKSWAMIKNIKIFETSSTLLVYEEFIQKYPQYISHISVVILFGFQQRVYMQVFQNGLAISYIHDKKVEKAIQDIQLLEQPIILGSGQEYISLNDLKFFNILQPDIRYSQLRESIHYKDLQPRYYRLTQAEEKQCES